MTTESVTEWDEAPEGGEVPFDAISYLGYLVKQQGGEARISRSDFEAADPEHNFLAFDFDEEADELVIKMIPASEVPVEMGGTKVD